MRVDEVKRMDAKGNQGVPIEEQAMSVRSLNEAIFRLGRVSADRTLTNVTLLRHLADVTLETLGVDVVLVSVFERGIESAPGSTCVRGPWSDDERDRYLEQARWRLDERVMAQRLGALRRGRLYHRSDLIVAESESREGRLSVESSPAFGLGDHAAALYRRSDGVELMISIHRVENEGAFARTTLARAGAIAPFVAQCWATSWKHEPEWMRHLKPLGRSILEQLLEGYDDDQIADRTGLSYHSVRAHLKRLFRDAGVRSRLHLMQACRPIENAATGLVVEIPTDELSRQATG